MKDVMRFKERVRLSPRFIRSFKILQIIREVAYKLSLCLDFSVVHLVFHISIL